MPHETALIATIAVSLAFAFVCGLAAVRLGLPPLVGYLIAGIAVGPFTPGFVGDAKLAGQLAEIGVILLMFGVGMQFSLRDLVAVRRTAFPGAVAKIVGATALGAWVAHLWGWSIGSGVVFGLALSVASTVVLLRALESQGTLDSEDGRMAVGWLVVEDLVMVVVLVLLPPLAGAVDGQGWSDVGMTVGWTLGKVSVFVGLTLLVGMRLLPWLLDQVVRTGVRELFSLAVVASALGVAFGAAELFGVSFALGAFFAGVVVNESDHSHRAAADLQPLQEVFAVLFFVSVGMLFDPAILIHQPLDVIVVLAIIIFGKSVIAYLIVKAFRYPTSVALTVAASLAQIGEFSFILAGLGVSLGLLPEEGRNLILAGSLLSIALNPFIFRVAGRIKGSEDNIARPTGRPGTVR